MQQQLLESEDQPDSRKDPFYKQQQKLYGWIAFVKFYFFDTQDAFVKITEGTGFLNSNWTMITAAHNLYLPNDKDKCSHCVVYLRDPNNEKKQIIIKSRSVEQWFENRELDLALVRLNEEVKHFQGGAFFASTADLLLLQQNKQQELFVTGFSNRMKTSIDITNDMVVVRSNFRNLQQNTVRYGGQTNKGLSGSPVIYRTGKKDDIRLKIVGLHLSRKPETQDCKGLLFSDDIINLIYSWMNRYLLDKVKIESRLSMMMAYFMKIFDTVKRQLLDNSQDGLKDHSKLQIMKRQNQYSLQCELRQNQPIIRNLQIQKAVAKKHQNFFKQLINNNKQEEICETIGDIYDLENQYQIADVFYQKSIELIDPLQDQKLSSAISNGQIINLKEKRQNIHKKMPKKCKKAIIGDLQLISRPIKKEKEAAKISQEKQFPEEPKLKHKISSVELSELFYQEPSASQDPQSPVIERNRINKFESKFKLQPYPSSSSEFQGSFDKISIISLPSFYKSEQNISSSFSSKLLTRYKSPELHLKDSNLRKMSHIQVVQSHEIFTFPHNCIGQITAINKNKNQNICATGFLISPDLVLTSAHPLLIKSGSDREIRKLVPISFSITQQEQTNKQNNKVVNPEFIRFPQYWNEIIKKSKLQRSNYKQRQQISIEKQIQQLKYDFALIRLETPIKRNQYFELMRDIDSFPELTVCGFTQEFGHSQISKSKRTAYKQNSILFHEINTTIGQSGSPIYFKDGNNVSLLGIHRPNQKASSLNMGTMITNQMISVIEDWAKQMGAQLKVSSIGYKQYQKQMYINKLNKELQQKQIMIYNLSQDLNNKSINIYSLCSNIDRLKIKEQQMEIKLKEQQKKLKKSEMEIHFLKLCRQQDLKKHLSENGKSESLIIDKQMLSKRKSNRRLDKRVQISDYGYNQIANKLRLLKNPDKITDLVIKNTVKIKSFSVRISCLRCIHR